MLQAKRYMVFMRRRQILKRRPSQTKPDYMFVCILARNHCAVFVFFYSADLQINNFLCRFFLLEKSFNVSVLQIARIPTYTYMQKIYIYIVLLLVCFAARSFKGADKKRNVHKIQFVCVCV